MRGGGGANRQIGVQKCKLGNKSPEIQDIIIVSTSKASVHQGWNLQNLRQNSLLPYKKLELAGQEVEHFQYLLDMFYCYDNQEDGI